MRHEPRGKGDGMNGSKYRLANKPFERDDAPLEIKAVCKRLVMENGCPCCRDLRTNSGRRQFCVFPISQRRCEGFEEKNAKTQKNASKGR